MAAITDICIEYLVNQYDAGAKILQVTCDMLRIRSKRLIGIQVFDTNGGEITPACYAQFCLEDFKRIPAEVRRKVWGWCGRVCVVLGETTTT